MNTPHLTPTRFFSPVRWTILLLLLVFLRGIMLCCAMPAFEGWDEYQHLARIDYQDRHGHSPVLGNAVVDPAFLRAIIHYPLPPIAAEQLASFGARSYAQFWTDKTPIVFHDTPLIELYEAQHAPGYYLLGLPIFRLLGGADHLVAIAETLRFINLFFMVAAVAFCMLTFQEFLPNSPLCQWTCAAAAMHPLFLITGVRVANDALAIFAASLILWLTARLIRMTSGERPWRWSLCITLGLLMGASVWTKATVLALLPLVLLMPLLADRQSTGSLRWKHRLTTISLILLLFFAVASPYFYIGYQQYGLLVPMYESVQNHFAGRGVTDLFHAALHINWFNQLRGWWGGPSLWIEGWTFQFASRNVRWFLYEPLILLGLLLTLVRFCRKPIDPAIRRALVFAAGVCSCFTLAMALHAAQSAAFRNGGVTTNVIYAAAAWPFEILILLSGFLTLPPKIGRWVAAALLILYFVIDLFGTLYRMPMTYGATHHYTLAIQRIATLHSAWLGTPTLLVASLLTLLLGLLAIFTLIRTSQAMPPELPR